METYLLILLYSFFSYRSRFVNCFLLGHYYTLNVGILLRRAKKTKVRKQQQKRTCKKRGDQAAFFFNLALGLINVSSHRYGYRFPNCQLDRKRFSELVLVCLVDLFGRNQLLELQEILRQSGRSCWIFISAVLNRRQMMLEIITALSELFFASG